MTRPGRAGGWEIVMEREASEVQPLAIQVESLPHAVRSRTIRMGSGRREYQKAVEIFKRTLIEHTLRQTGWNRTEAAKLLGLQRTYLVRLIRGLRVVVPACTGGENNTGTEND